MYPAGRLLASGRMTSARSRVAVVGAGAIGRNHVRVLRELPAAELTAVVDPDAARAGELAALYGVKTYADYRRMLDHEQPDAVIVAVPTHLHREVALAAFDRGCHVLVEKP